jgi:DNA-binding Lrp family transcriptional regulator
MSSATSPPRTPIRRSGSRQPWPWPPANSSGQPTTAPSSARYPTRHARLQAARQLLATGQPADAEAQLRRVLAFYRQVRAAAYVREAEACRPRPLHRRKRPEELEAAIVTFDEVVAVRRLFGQPDYLVQVAVADAVEYEAFLTGKLIGLPALNRTVSHQTIKRVKG